MMEDDNILASSEQYHGDIADMMLGMEPHWDITPQTTEMEITAINQNPL